MKIKLFYIISLLVVLSFAVFLLKGKITGNVDVSSSLSVENGSGFLQENNYIPETEPLGLAEEEIESEGQTFNGTIQNSEKTVMLWNQINSMPDEKEYSIGVTNPWRAIGPYGSVTDKTSKFTGRVLDIEIQSGGGVRIAAATGGLWESTATLPKPLSDNVPSLAVGSFDSQPGDSNLIILGTGEPRVSNGTGLYRTTNGGTNWQRISLGNTPTGFYKIRFDTQNKNIVHLAGTNGYYRSTNAGLNWTKHLDGEITDVTFNPANTKIVYCGKYDNGTGAGGVYKSNDGGSSWFKMKNDGLPTANVGRTSVSVCAGAPNVLYVLMSTNDPGGRMLGIFRSFTDDSDFIKISPPKDILGIGFGWYVNAIAVCPTNPAICLAGGIYLWRTSDFGRNWNIIEYFGGERDTNMHSDIHSIVWDRSGNSVWVGNDGGTTFSDQKGNNKTFSTSKNNWPITQYVNFDISLSNPKVIFGGSRDNAFTVTTNGGISWSYTFNGPADGSGAAIDPTNPEIIYGTLGELGGNWRFGYFRSLNSGKSWEEIGHGIAPTREFYTRIRTNNIAPINVYTQSGGHLYFSVDKGASWILRNAVAFPAEIEDFSVRDYDPADPDQVIYVSLKSGDTANRIKFQQNRSNFQERSSGIPAGYSVRKVIPHPTNINVAYALINPNNDDKIVYKTTDKGLNWVNINGNLPDVNVRDLIANPLNDNILYLGTETGCFKTTDGGTTWFKWNDGMPAANIVSEMKAYEQNGRYYIAVSTYGRGIWIRDETDANPADNKITKVQAPGVPDKFALFQNYPNPFNPTTKIRFDIPTETIAKITVYDAEGREVSVLLNGHVQAGSYETEFNTVSLSSGIYFYKLEAGSFTDVRKMVLLK